MEPSWTDTLDDKLSIVGAPKAQDISTDQLDNSAEMSSGIGFEASPDGILLVL